MKNKKGFTLVELLAVIAILAILVIIALPNVINMYNKAQKETFLTEAKKIYSEAEKKYISSSITGDGVKKISSEDNSKLDMTGEKLQYCIILNNGGKVKSMKVSNGKWIASLEDGKAIEDLTIDDLEEGNLDNFDCSSNKYKVSSPEPIYCTFDGELTQGAEYVNGQYTYRYMQEGKYSTSDLSWSNINTDGWGVQLTDKESTDAVTSKLCTYINNKPVLSMSNMFSNSQATMLDVSNFNTSNVINMSDIFSDSQATTIDVSNFDTSKVIVMSLMFYNSAATSITGLSNFNTSNVTNMSGMFSKSQATTLDVSNFNTSNVINMSWMFENSQATTIDVSNFNTSKVTDMNGMFSASKATTLDVSNFDTSKVTDMSYMFSASKATTIDLNNFDTSKVTNMHGMFYNTKAKTIYSSDKFITNSVTNSSNMFAGATNLVGGNGTKYNSSYIDKTYARIDTASTPGYFTLKTN